MNWYYKRLKVITVLISFSLFHFQIILLFFLYIFLWKYLLLFHLVNQFSYHYFFIYTYYNMIWYDIFFISIISPKIFFSGKINLYLKSVSLFKEKDIKLFLNFNKISFSFPFNNKTILIVWFGSIFITLLKLYAFTFSFSILRPKNVCNRNELFSII